MVRTCFNTTLHSSDCLLPLLCPEVYSLCLGLCSCPANRFVSIIFLNSIYIHIYALYLFFWLTSLCITVCYHFCCIFALQLFCFFRRIIVNILLNTHICSHHWLFLRTKPRSRLIGAMNINNFISLVRLFFWSLLVLLGAYENALFYLLIH